MATETDGSCFTVSRKMRLSTIFQQIEDEMRSQYSIGYSPQQEPGRSEFRKITLECPRKGVTVQARAGYYMDAIRVTVDPGHQPPGLGGAAPSGSKPRLHVGRRPLRCSAWKR